ncbi:MAG: hypothetical protein GY780_05480 [bacterium]|nr:hypothetical protein [bacterium]
MQTRIISLIIHSYMAAFFLCCALPAIALENFDFETPYLVHPQRQIWDFSLIRHNDQYHLYYHTIAQQTPHPAQADTIWHATSEDLKSWNIDGPVLTSGPDWYDETAMWAPHVVFDPASERWAMLYTGVASGMVQRACLAWSHDLHNWEKSAANPVFEPDNQIYFWDADVNWSSFRDPFVFHDGQQWNMLSTCALRLGTYPGYRRAIVHRATSSNLIEWSDGGVFFEHDGTSGRANDFESVQYHVRDGWHHLFFVEQDPNVDHHATSHMVASDPNYWTMHEREFIDAGWAPEIIRFDSDARAEVYARLAKGQDPRDDSWFVTVRFDSLRYTDNGFTAEVYQTPDLADSWLEGQGDFETPRATFRDNALWRMQAGSFPEGHGWFNSRENYSGPLSGMGSPGDTLGSSATGKIESKEFLLRGRTLRLLLAGSFHPDDCYVALLDATTDQILDQVHSLGETALTERFWDVSLWHGQFVKLAVVDLADEGWIAVDGIEEQDEYLSAIDQGPGLARLQTLKAVPSPFNGHTEFRLELKQQAPLKLEIFDVRGYKVWQAPELLAPAGITIVPWDSGNLASGTYMLRALLNGRPAGVLRFTLVE